MRSPPRRQLRPRVLRADAQEGRVHGRRSSEGAEGRQEPTGQPGGRGGEGASKQRVTFGHDRTLPDRSLLDAFRDAFSIAFDCCLCSLRGSKVTTSLLCSSHYPLSFLGGSGMKQRWTNEKGNEGRGGVRSASSLLCPLHPRQRRR